MSGNVELGFGVDVSEFQGTINWKKVRSSGITFAMIRGGFSTTLDSEAINNLSGATAAGVKCGIYWFGYPLSVEDAKREAQCCIELAKKYKLEYPIAYDFEYDSVRYMRDNGISANMENITAFTRAFCETVEAAGYYVMVYTNYDYYNNYFDKSLWENYDMWLADWDDKGYKPRLSYAHIVQYTSQGRVDGINGNVDRNYSVRDYPGIIAGMNIESGEKPETVPMPVPDPEPVNEIVYTIQRGDTLWGIGEKYGVSYQTIANYNGITNPSLIYPGQKIKIPGTNSGSNGYSTYTVQSGDTLSGIAAKYGTTYQKIAADNGISNPNLIHPGQVLKIY